MARRSAAVATFLLLLAAATPPAAFGGIPPPRRSLTAPRWEPTYSLSRSTIAMPCNDSGFMDPATFRHWGVLCARPNPHAARERGGLGPGGHRRRLRSLCLPPR